MKEGGRKKKETEKKIPVKKLAVSSDKFNKCQLIG